MFSQVFAAAFIALPFLAQSVLAGDCTRSYTIKDGDICDQISAANNVSTYQLAAINTGVIDPSCSNLNPGSTICLGYAGEDCSTTYVVVADDTCEQITASHGINSTILYLNNPQINGDCTNIYVGEVLCTSNTVQVPPAPAGNFVPGAVIPVTAAPAKPTPAHQEPSVPPTTTPAPAPSTGGNDDDNDDDDEDLPFCDEI